MPDYLKYNKADNSYQIYMRVPKQAVSDIGKATLGRKLEAKSYDEAVIEAAPFIESFRKTIAAAGSSKRRVTMEINLPEDVETQERFVALIKSFDPAFDPMTLVVRKPQK